MNPYANHGIADPFSNPSGKGPSEAGWERDANDLGFKHVNFNVQKEEKPEIAEFKDLFSMGKKEFKTTTSPRQKIDLTYNPGVNKAQAPQQQPVQ